MPVAELVTRLQSNPFAAAASLDSRRFALRNSFAAAARQCISASALCLCCHSLYGCSVAPPPASAPAQAPSVLFRPLLRRPCSTAVTSATHFFRPSVCQSAQTSLAACLPAYLPACLRLSECVTARRPKLAAAAATCHSALVGLASNASGTTLLCELAFRARSALHTHLFAAFKRPPPHPHAARSLASTNLRSKLASSIGSTSPPHPPVQHARSQQTLQLHCSLQAAAASFLALKERHRFGESSTTTLSAAFSPFLHLRPSLAHADPPFGTLLHIDCHREPVIVVRDTATLALTPSP
ncbi:hypothetical protein L1887_59100 [Cichorium endivia]|nr:hypothetical protein L1887_59100 [Cichorium endivia]